MKKIRNNLSIHQPYCLTVQLGLTLPRVFSARFFWACRGFVCVDLSASSVRCHYPKWRENQRNMNPKWSKIEFNPWAKHPHNWSFSENPALNCGFSFTNKFIHSFIHLSMKKYFLLVFFLLSLSHSVFFEKLTINLKVIKQFFHYLDCTLCQFINSFI